MCSVRSVRGIAYPAGTMSRAVHLCTDQLRQIGRHTGFPYCRSLVSVLGLMIVVERLAHIRFIRRSTGCVLMAFCLIEHPIRVGVLRAFRPFFAEVCCTRTEHTIQIH